MCKFVIVAADITQLSTVSHLTGLYAPVIGGDEWTSDKDKARCFAHLGDAARYMWDTLKLNASEAKIVRV